VSNEQGKTDNGYRITNFKGLRFKDFKEFEKLLKENIY